MRSLADLKRRIILGKLIEVVSTTVVWFDGGSPKTGIVRIVKAQNNAFAYVRDEPPSPTPMWTDYGKAAGWTFDGDLATVTRPNGSLTYRVMP